MDFPKRLICSQLDRIGFARYITHPGTLQRVSGMVAVSSREGHSAALMLAGLFGVINLPLTFPLSACAL